MVALIAIGDHDFLFRVPNICKAFSIVIYDSGVFNGLFRDINGLKRIDIIIVVIYHINTIQQDTTFIKYPGLIGCIVNELGLDFRRVLHLV